MSGESKYQSILGQISWRVFVSTFAVIILFFLFLPLWAVGPVQVILHTLLAFLGIIGVGVISFDIRRNRVTWKFIFLTFFIFTAIVNFVAATWHLNPLYAVAEVVELSADLFEMILLGILILITLISTRFNQSETTLRRGIVVIFGITFGALFLYGFVYYFLLPIAMFIDPVLTELSLGSICLAIYIAIGIILLRQPQILNRFHTVTFLNGFILMVASTICLMASYFLPFTLISASIMLRAAMMFSYFVTIAIPVQTELTISETRAELYATILAFLAVIPSAITLLVVTFIPLSSVFSEQGIYTLTHLIAAFLAGVIVRLLWLFTKQQPHWHRYPLILAFITVTIVESIILFLSPWVELTGEYTVLYVLAGIMIMFWLYLTLRWIYHPPTDRKHDQMAGWLAYHSAFMLLIVLFGVWLQNFLYVVLPWWTVQYFLRISLLSVCFTAVFFLTYLFIIFIQVSKGSMSMGFIVLGTLSLWLIANIIRVLFPDWTAGWWAAQFFILFGFLLAPSTLGRLYLVTLERSERERKRATLYADILVHDLRNYHTVIQTSLDLLTLAQDPSDFIDTTTDNIQIALNRADRLITNVRSLEMASSLKPQDLIKIDVVEVITEAWEHVIEPDDVESKIEMNQKLGQCFVLANNLLLEVFINLLRNALQYSEDVKRVHLEIHPVEKKDARYWKISLTDWGRGISPKQKEKLFTRYTEGAKGLGLGLSVVKSLSEAFGGSVKVENRVVDDYTKGTVFILMLIRST